MTAPFLEVLGRTSLSAAVMILAVVALRLRFRQRTPQRVFCLLWDIVLLRLLVLYDITSPVSVRRLLAMWPSRAVSAVAGDMAPAQVTMAGGTVYQMQIAQDSLLAYGTAPTSAPLDRTTLFAALWLAGLFICGIWILWGHLRSRAVYAVSLPVRSSAVLDWQAAHPIRRPVQVRQSDRIASPLTYGVLYPVVLLPAGMDLEDAEVLSCVLAHEYTHIRRFDTLRKGLLALALCLHWFNPFVWVMYLLANRDIELACDEAVVRSGASRRDYALALLRLEEERGRGFLSGSSFSRNALEERIEAIMKLKKISLTAVVAVLVAMSAATTVFATGAPASKGEAQTGYVYDHFQAVEDEISVISRGDTGERFFSVDGGDHWMTEDRYHAQYGDWGDNWTVEWWTYDEYKTWLEEEKEVLQSIIGERGYTSSEGWFVWDQKKVDEAIARYEEILENIRSGALYSKEIYRKDGSVVQDVMLGSGTATDVTIASAFDTSEMVRAEEEKKVNIAALLADCESYGLTGSEWSGLFYNGQRVRCFVDGVSAGDGCSIQYTYYSEVGTIDVHTLHAVLYNPDGSYDPFGKLIGLAAPGDANFDPDLINCADPTSTVQSTSAETELFQDSGNGRTLAEIFARYESFGLTCAPRENSFVSLSCNGQPVSCFADLRPDGGAFTYEDPFVKGGAEVCTVYDENGVLTGLDVIPAAA